MLFMIKSIDEGTGDIGVKQVMKLDDPAEPFVVNEHHECKQLLCASHL